ncbi:MFS transporter [Chitinasiproducens palmae]|uniref:Predicted arabinose efflux permease, MFS family n=1 Tax=Chitinasiproducens palmae TaxID=1770053 RepID=A0A1H2PJT0_9BURK|nr:MFS transporter [Chitinasiproducens palmae]SDV46138.1 Predicted arabinose efflux permease, MFS family [Chitinasiproducens palmae]
MSSKPASLKATQSSGKWYVGATSDQWRSFSSAYIGWMLDIMDLMLFAMVIRFISADLHFDKGVAGAIASLTLLATAVGGLIFGYLADRIGRTRSMVLSILCYSVGTALCGFADSVAQLLVFRFILGLGIGGEWSAGAALITETWPAEHRGKVMAWVQSAFAAGYALAALVAAAVLPHLGWRWVFAVGLLPALFAFWVRRHTHESEIWLRQKQRLTLRETAAALFGTHLRSTLVGLAFTAAAMCGYWGLFTWIPAYLATPVSEGGPGFDLMRSTTWIVVMQVGAALGFICFGYIADRIGRRLAFILFFACSAVAVPLYVAIQSPWLLLTFGPVVAFFGTGFYSGFAPTFAELFPTNVRATAQGFIYNTGRATSALAPAMVGFLSSGNHVGSALAATAGFFALAALIVFFFLPETRGGELE